MLRVSVYEVSWNRAHQLFSPPPPFPTSTSFPKPETWNLVTRIQGGFQELREKVQGDRHLSERLAAPLVCATVWLFVRVYANMLLQLR